MGMRVESSVEPWVGWEVGSFVAVGKIRGSRAVSCDPWGGERRYLQADDDHLRRVYGKPFGIYKRRVKT
jgi:hypothetical protein